MYNASFPIRNSGNRQTRTSHLAATCFSLYGNYFRFGTLHILKNPSPNGIITYDITIVKPWITKGDSSECITNKNEDYSFTPKFAHQPVSSFPYTKYEMYLL